MLAATGGHFVPQVVDLYLVCQYARAMAEGHPFQYNAGRAGLDGRHQPAPHGRARRSPTRRGSAAKGWWPSRSCRAPPSPGHASRWPVAPARALGGERDGLLAGGAGGPGRARGLGLPLRRRHRAVHVPRPRGCCERCVAAWTGGPLRGVVAAAASCSRSTRPEGLPHRRGPSPPRWRPVPARGARGAAPARLAAAWRPGSRCCALYRALTGSWVGTSVADKSLFANLRR